MSTDTIIDEMKTIIQNHHFIKQKKKKSFNWLKRIKETKRIFYLLLVIINIIILLNAPIIQFNYQIITPSNQNILNPIVIKENNHTSLYQVQQLNISNENYPFMINYSYTIPAPIYSLTNQSYYNLTNLRDVFNYKYVNYFLNSHNFNYSINQIQFNLIGITHLYFNFTNNNQNGFLRFQIYNQTQEIINQIIMSKASINYQLYNINFVLQNNQIYNLPFNITYTIIT